MTTSSQQDVIKYLVNQMAQMDVAIARCTGELVYHRTTMAKQESDLARMVADRKSMASVIESLGPGKIKGDDR